MDDWMVAEGIQPLNFLRMKTYYTKIRSIEKDFPFSVYKQ